MTYEETFITNHQNLVDKFGDNSVIMEGEYYYVKIPIVYQGADFKVNGHKFYMTAELHEYPLETYQYLINESNYMNDENNYQSLGNSRLGTSIYLLNKWDKNNGFLRNGDILTFVIRIDKNVVKGQEKNRNSIDCRVGGVKQFSKECRITLSDYNFLVVYLKNYDFDFNRRKLGEIESFVYKDYPIDLHENETQHLVNLTANNTPRSNNFPVKFNPKDFSPYLVNGIDTIKSNNIHLRRTDGFDTSKLVNSKGECKTTNRNMFPIECPYLEDEHLDGINQMIEDWRKETKDFFLTSFKTCKYDGTYRKRISFIEVRWILSNYFSLTEAFKLST